MRALGMVIGLWIALVPATLYAQVAPELKPVPIAKSTVMERAKGAVVPFKINTPKDSDYLLKLASAKTGKTVMLIYVKAGSSFQTKVPLGDYEIRGVTGATWYGTEHLFGPDGSYFRLVLNDSESKQVFSFSQTKTKKSVTYHGHELTLTPVVNGNVKNATISAEEF